MDRTLSFSEIYRQHADAVFRLAWMLTGKRSDAEDLTSEAFARALAGEGRRNLVSSRQRRPAVELEAEDEQVAEAPGLDPGPEQQAELRQRLAHAGAGLAALREGERQVLLLCGVHGLSTPDIADALGLEPGHVRVRLHRARRQLQLFLDQQESAHGPA
jgi:RNA polymerase sigma-70 factor (ECF subfamily)